MTGVTHLRTISLVLVLVLALAAGIGAGAQVAAARPYIRVAHHTVTFPGLAIMLTVLALNMVGDGLRDALDPRIER